MNPTTVNARIEWHQSAGFPHDAAPVHGCPICRAQAERQAAEALTEHYLDTFRWWRIEHCPACLDDLDGTCGWHMMRPDLPYPRRATG